MSVNVWTSDEQLLALRLYCILPFGKLHQSNSEVIALAEAIGRTPSAVAMKACNFASLDPALDRQGLGNVSRADRHLWEEFQADSASVAERAETLSSGLVESSRTEGTIDQLDIPIGETESVQSVRVRRVQGFFRKSLLVGYNNQCALSGLSIPELLIASHIIPWKDDEKRRADPTNGIMMNALYDRAFDKGYISFDEHYRVLISCYLHKEIEESDTVSELFRIEGRELMMPVRFTPDIRAIRYHRENIYKS